VAEKRKARANRITEAMEQRARPISRAIVAFLPLAAALGLCAFQFGARNGLNSLPADVRA